MSLWQKYFSPQSDSGSLVWSVGAHVLVCGLAVGILSLSSDSPEPEETYLDLGYETFDEPPEPVQEEQRVVRSPAPVVKPEPQAVPDHTPQELQDEKSEVAGTQEAAKSADIGSASDGVAATTPFYKIKPKYPKAALVSGTEGWVLLNIDINESGEVENVRVIDGEQRNMFQSEARRAVSQWKYRPFVDDSGRPFRKHDHQVRVDFKLEEAGT